MICVLSSFSFRRLLAIQSRTRSRQPAKRSIASWHEAAGTLIYSCVSSAYACDVPVRITRESRRSASYEGITEALKVPNLSHVYSGRSVLPAQFTKLRVRVVNADTREQVLRKGTRLGKLERAEVIETSNQPSSPELLASEVDVVEQMMSSLPKELTREQQRAPY